MAVLLCPQDHRPHGFSERMRVWQAERSKTLAVAEGSTRQGQKGRTVRKALARSGGRGGGTLYVVWTGSKPYAGQHDVMQLCPIASPTAIPSSASAAGERAPPRTTKLQVWGMPHVSLAGLITAADRIPATGTCSGSCMCVQTRAHVRSRDSNIAWRCEYSQCGLDIHVTSTSVRQENLGLMHTEQTS